MRLESQRKKVLVVENDEIVGVLVSHILTRNSYVVHTTTDIVHADNLLQQHDYSAVLMDIRVPNGGIDFIHKLAERTPHMLPRIIVSTGALHDVTRLSPLRVHSVVKKPFELYGLLDTVNDCATRA
jgi:DNA-binding NtrC family response regulator